jgi:hypothetical protein
MPHRPNPQTGHAAVLRDAKHSVQNWCHDPDSIEGNHIWHASKEDAFSCFHRNRPGLLEAIDAIGVDVAS